MATYKQFRKALLAKLAKDPDVKRAAMVHQLLAYTDGLIGELTAPKKVPDMPELDTAPASRSMAITVDPPKKPADPTLPSMGGGSESIS